VLAAAGEATVRARISVVIATAAEWSLCPSFILFTLAAKQHPRHPPASGKRGRI
jgi:hypothetical protein